MRVYGQAGTTILEPATQHQVTPSRVSYYGVVAVLLTCLDWRRKYPAVAVVGVRSKPVLVDRVLVFPWSQRIVSGCVPKMSWQLVSRCSHYHNQAHLHIQCEFTSVIVFIGYRGNHQA